MAGRSNKKIRTKRMRARDDARRFEEFVKAHNEEVAEREAQEARGAVADNDDFAEGFLAKMRRSLGV